MCGIIGIAADAPSAERAWLAAGRDALGHRGPDGAGLWWSADGRVGLAHRRLAILDRSAAGHQPMHDAAGTLSIVFNGEIYNVAELRAALLDLGHTFRSRSDTEVLLAAYRQWGDDCLHRLNGMFAFALFDAGRGRLLLARDRVGEKPLFLYHTPGELRFASELKGLLADPALPRRVDPVALDCYLAMGHVPGARCILQGFAKLPPACALCFDLTRGTLRTWRYWELPPPCAQERAGPAHEAALLDRFEALLADAVARQLVADVPVGVLLSGGVDSSLITAMAARACPRVKTFTIGFPGHGALDETAHARLVARHFGTEHVELTAEPAVAALLPVLARQFDEPVADSSMFPTYLVSRLVRDHCAVALGGDGGDELFGGYHAHSRLLFLARYFGRVPRPLRALPAALGAALPPGVRGRNYLMALGEDLRRAVPHLRELFDRRARGRLLPGVRPAGSAEAVRAAGTPEEADALERATRMDFGGYLAEDILVKVDRAAMLNSLEVRAPLLDYRLVEFAFGAVPARLKATAWQRKVLPKRLAARLLPPAFDRRRKQGFSIPLAAWLRAGPLRELFLDVLHDRGGIFDPRALAELLRAQERGRDNGERLFALVLFELWRREYRCEL